MNKDIQTLIEKEACEHWSQSNYKEVAEKAHSGNDMCKTSAMARKVSNSSFQAGASFALSLFKWRKVSDGLPEHTSCLINPDGETTSKVVVRSTNGFYSVDHRVKSDHNNPDGTSHWNWTKLNENQVTEWMPIPQID